MWPHSNCLQPLRLKAWVLTISGAQQTVTHSRKRLFCSHITEPVCPTHFHKMGIYYETISNICPNLIEQNSHSQTFFVGCLHGVKVDICCHQIYISFTDRFMFTNININIFRWSLVNCVSICILLTGINSDM
jgi:hypothetical protein